MPVIVGIDPGIAPTVCVLIDDPGKPLAVEFSDGEDTSYLTTINGKDVRRPSAPMLRCILRDAFASLVAIEDVHSMPAQGVTSTFAFGYASGMVEGVASAMGLRVLRVAPQVWKKAYRLAPRADKSMSRHIASNLAPHLAEHFRRVMDHNRAEAFLIAYWARSRVNDALEPSQPSVFVSA
jgi:crossover junction endodeoxyribonuclease RuvC